jgi:branched-subunit amino acid ABC-type transport system permease component
MTATGQMMIGPGVAVRTIVSPTTVVRMIMAGVAGAAIPTTTETAPVAGFDQGSIPIEQTLAVCSFGALSQRLVPTFLRLAAGKPG